MQASMKKAVAALTEADPEDKRSKKRIRPELWPSADFRDVGIRGDLSELKDVRTEEQATFQGKQEERKFIDVVADVKGRRMEKDDGDVVLGEDVHRLKGGTNGANQARKDHIPDRDRG